MRYFTLCLLLLFISYRAHSQADSTKADSTSHWKKSIESGANVNQASFSDNWKGGGVSSIALGMLLNGKLNYESKRVSFVNDLQTQYGFLKNKGSDFRKNADRIFFDSKIGYKIKPKLDLYTSVNFISQFSLGYEYKTDRAGKDSILAISNFMSPAYLTSSVGMEYKPVDFFSMRFGVGSFRQTFVLDTTIHRHVPQNYGVPIGSKVRNELAFLLTANLDKNIAKNMNLKARFTAFANYETLKAIDTRLDIILTAKINKLINVNLSSTILYDQDMDYKIQFAQTLSLGILLKYSEFK